MAPWANLLSGIASAFRPCGWAAMSAAPASRAARRASRIPLSSGTKARRPTATACAAPSGSRVVVCELEPGDHLAVRPSDEAVQRHSHRIDQLAHHGPPRLAPILRDLHLAPPQCSSWRVDRGLRGETSARYVRKSGGAVADSANMRKFARISFKPFGGLEPPTPFLPFRLRGARRGRPFARIHVVHALRLCRAPHPLVKRCRGGSRMDVSGVRRIQTPPHRRLAVDHD
jgi:hypothetical protein